MPTDPLTARCAECLGEFRLKKDGTMRWHLGDWCVGGWRQMCAGVGKPPATVSEHQDGDQKSRIETCPTCKTTTLSFDPPLYFEASEACGAIKPGNYGNSPGGIPQCHGPAGHDGEHYYLVEYIDRWPAP